MGEKYLSFATWCLVLESKDNTYIHVSKQNNDSKINKQTNKQANTNR